MSNEAEVRQVKRLKSDSVPEKMVSKQRKIIFDTDMGADDAVAFLLCLQQPELDILAVTAVHGNSHVDQVCINQWKQLPL